MKSQARLSIRVCHNARLSCTVLPVWQLLISLINMLFCIIFSTVQSIDACIILCMHGCEEISHVLFIWKVMKRLQY